MRIPRSTYRLQVNADFTLQDVRNIVPYLAELGISDLYISPIYEARAGSPHGYDVVRHDRINPEIGSIEDLRALADAAHAHGMGILLDIVPNHMAASESNPWWRDVLENGRASEFAGFFDIDWQADPPGTGKVLLPVLGQPLDAAISAGEVTAAVKDGLPVLRYYDRDFPLDPATYAQFFEFARIHDPDVRRDIADVPHREDVHRRSERLQKTETARRAVRDFFRRNPGRTIDVPAKFLRALHDAQPYSLWYWVRGTRRINYRRFFDISDLAGLRVEEPHVFEAVHGMTLSWVRSGYVSGLRIDHIDGLRDPEAYLQRLRERTDAAYVIVEKVLIGEERLPESWAAEGTTGYDFAGRLNAVLLDPGGYDRLRTWYEAETGVPPFESVLVEKKRLVIDTLFDGEIRDLTAAFVDLAARMGVTLPALHAQEAITSLTAALPVYRTYISERGVPDESRKILLATREKIPAENESVRLLMRMLLLDVPAEHQSAILDFVMRWQQFTGPVMAKGLEDTAFYNYNALISTCEVGTYPPGLDSSVDALHRFLEQRQARWPHTLNASSTHDTKRSEDVRTRISVLTEIADEWIAFVEECDSRSAQSTDVEVPDLNERLLIYQTLLGAWPFDDRLDDSFRERMREFLLKALREAKLHTSWSEIDETYETAALAWCDALLDSGAFEARSRDIRQRIALCGALNSLSQLVWKLGAPGVPDFYQGTETWFLALVDPDNRRPANYDLAARLVRDRRSVREKFERWQDGAIKAAVTRAGLAVRNARPDLFTEGAYMPLQASGSRAAQVVAFARSSGDATAVFAAARWYTRLCRRGLPDPDVWDDTALDIPPITGRWRNVLTGASVSVAPGERTRVRLARLFNQLPFAILVSER